MSNINILIIFGISIVVALLLTVLIVLINKGKKTVEKKVLFENKKIPMPSVDGLHFHSGIEKINRQELLGIVRKIFISYRYFDYKSMSMDELDKKEWHSWQISMLIRLFYYDEEFFIPDQGEIFPDFLAESDEDKIKDFMNSILKKYENYVNANKTKDELCKDYIWSNKDISVIFCFLTNYKHY